MHLGTINITDWCKVIESKSLNAPKDQLYLDFLFPFSQLLFNSSLFPVPLCLLHSPFLLFLLLFLLKYPFESKSLSELLVHQ